jgi:hypothetical protein
MKRFQHTAADRQALALAPEQGCLLGDENRPRVGDRVRRDIADAIAFKLHCMRSLTMRMRRLWLPGYLG